MRISPVTHLHAPRLAVEPLLSLRTCSPLKRAPQVKRMPVAALCDS